MITRIEIDGFKSFLDFQLDIPPFLALVGPNASGKSNLFDALDFAGDALLSALVREMDPLLIPRRGKPQELFHRPGRSAPVEWFDLVVEAETPLAGRDHIRAEIRSSRDPVRAAVWHVTTSPPFADREWPAEVASWHLHVPEPSAMRRPVTAADRRALTEDAGNLAAVLGRMEGTDALADLVVDLAALIPDVTGVQPVFDQRQEEWSFDILVDHEPVPGRLASDGTLRILALLAALHDPDHAGSIMVEELENGLHPSRLRELLTRIRQRVLSGDSRRQVIFTSHSPVVVSALYAEDPGSLVFLDTAWRAGGGLPRSRVTVARPVRSSGEPGEFVSPRQVRKYLSSVGQLET
ncbi:recombination protein RecF [Spongiactinospora rosea]|uniref:Recombination protein RecF n=1 Tax=Spongiactinospora rosea TaxID=2248750 RepID=A0A366LLC2_9ACTN|nr:ATP-binding protein [Spongiactinospora rosea]RBQ14293.1 recombination protein RecF [Spongiactinospora rosea]